MKTTRIHKLKYAAAPLAIGLALISTPSFAQDAADEEEPAGEIVVTGSLIQNPNLVQSTPVNATTADEIDLLQSNVAEEVLRELPGVVPSIGSAVNNGNGGASYVDLRGLGSIRNIVLLDGQRIAPSGLAGRVDLNNIPLALIERVDALTGAAVTTYGADAITGVVNFVTRKDFAALKLLLQPSSPKRAMVIRYVSMPPLVEISMMAVVTQFCRLVISRLIQSIKAHVTSPTSRSAATQVVLLVPVRRYRRVSRELAHLSVASPIRRRNRSLSVLVLLLQHSRLVSRFMPPTPVAPRMAVFARSTQQVPV